MLIDTHAHVNFKAFKEDAGETLQRALDEGIWVNNVGTQIETSRQAVELAEQFPPHPSSPSRGEEKGGGGIFATVGLHPVHTYSQHLDEEETSFRTKEEKFDYEAYRTLAKNPKVVGIGECGLDYYRLPEDINLHQKVKNLQKDAFLQQIQLAKDLDKALVVHSRSTQGTDDATQDIYDILKLQISTPFLDPSPLEGEGRVGGLRFVLHSYTGSPEVLQKFLDLGGYVSFNGIITFDKTGNMEKLVNLIPLDRILVETDCPYLTPVPHRGKRNEPMFVKHVAEHLAKMKGASLVEIEKITTKNAKRLFKI